MAEEIYKLTASFPETERWGLTSQIRRSAVSISSNIAEGAGRATSKELARYLRIALGSLAELDSQLELARRIGLFDAKPAASDSIVALRRQLIRLHQRIVANS